MLNENDAMPVPAVEDGTRRIRAVNVFLSNANGTTTQGVFFLLAGLAVLRSQAPLAIGFQLAAQSLPALIVLLLRRTAKPRFSFRTALLMSLWLQAVSALLFAVVSMLIGYNVRTAVVMSLIYAAGSTIQAPGRRTIIADIFDEQRRRRALAGISAYSNGARLLAPAVAGLMLATNFWQWWFVLDAVTTGASALALAKARRALEKAPNAVGAQHSPPKETMLKMTSRNTVTFLVAFGIICVFGFNIQVLAPLIARDVLHSSATLTGVVVSIHTLGSLFGAALVARADRYLRGSYILRAAILGAGLLAVSIPWIQAEIIVFITVFIAGIGRGLVLTTSSTMTATWGDSNQFREDLIALTSVIFTASNLLSAAVIAVVLLFGSSSTLIWVCGLGTLLAAAVALLIPRTWDS